MIPAQFLIAQAAPAVPEATVGQLMSALCVLAVIVGSLSMGSVWLARWKQCGVAIPQAARKPLRVPLLLLACGFLMSGLMALLASVAPALDDMAAAGEAVELDSGAGESSAGEGETADADPAMEVAADEASLVTGDEVQEADADGPVAAKKKPTGQQVYNMILGNIQFNLVIFAIFGITIWMGQDRRSRLVLNADDIGYEVATTAWDQSFQRFPDLDSPPESETPNVGENGRTEYIAAEVGDAQNSVPDRTNPYASAGLEFSNRNNASGEDSGQKVDSLKNPEPWVLSTELRFALETFLVAYFPTTAIRILIVSLLPESPSHPFLEIIENGVSWDIIALIFFMAVVIAPLVEELQYRVVLLGGMQQRNLQLAGWILSSVLFGLAHGFPDCIALLPLAFAIGYVYSQRRSYRTAVLVHFLFNLFNMLLAGLSMM
ncbi:MAG: CPBP family intramembrane glutamic endopeptidase [Fuerstiella sp.]